VELRGKESILGLEKKGDLILIGYLDIESFTNQ
jgi:hypothetical protein